VPRHDERAGPDRADEDGDVDDARAGDSGRAERAVALARATGDVVAVLVQPARGIEHALRSRCARRAPGLAQTFGALGALLVALRGGVVHARRFRHARRAEVEARARAAGETREVLVDARVIGAGRRRAADIGERDRCRAAAAWSGAFLRAGGRRAGRGW